MQGHDRAAAGLLGFPTARALQLEESARRKSRLEELRAKHAAVSQVPNLQGHPGFRVFLESIARMRDESISRLLSADPDPATMLKHREHAVALDQILDLVQRHETMAADLAERIRSEEQVAS